MLHQQWLRTGNAISFAFATFEPLSSACSPHGSSIDSREFLDVPPVTHGEDYLSLPEVERLVQRVSSTTLRVRPSSFLDILALEEVWSGCIAESISLSSPGCSVLCRSSWTLWVRRLSSGHATVARNAAITLDCGPVFGWQSCSSSCAL